MRKLHYILILIITASVFSCGNKTEGNPEADSLKNVINGQSAEIDNLNLFLDAVNASMDSVINLEGGLLRKISENPNARGNIMQNIEAYKQILQRQRDRIATLEERLKDGEGNAAKMLQTIASLKKQLDEKDNAIVELTKELGKRHVDIQNLRKNVGQLNTKVSELEEEKKVQEEALITQSDMMNEAYVFIGSKKELKAAGILTGGSLFKKSKLNAANVNLQTFKKIDIRKVNSFTIPAKKAEILTQMPVNSYRIESNGDKTCTLHVTDPSTFWSLSNILIVKY